MSRAAYQRFVFTLIGLAISAAAICYARETAGTLGAPAGPFGFPALVVVHLFAAWPVAWGLSQLEAPTDPRRHRLYAVMGVLTAMVVVAATYRYGNSLWSRFNGDLPTEFALGWLVRETWALALMTPWCFAAGQKFPELAEPHARNWQWSFLGCSLLAALCVPAAFADYLFRQQTDALETRFQEGRLDGLPELAGRLRAAGSSDRVGEWTIDAFHQRLSEQIAEYRQAADAPLPQDADRSAVLRRAALLATLGDHDRVIKLLTPIADSNPSAGLLLASVLDDLGRHAEAAQRFHAVIEILNGAAPPDAERLRIQAFDGLAETLRDQHAYFAAEAAYMDAIRTVPQAEAHFRFQLGRHYALGGRPAAAMQSFQRAAQLAPLQFGFDRPEVQQHVRPLREGTPGCLLPMSAYRSP